MVWIKLRVKIFNVEIGELRSVVNVEDAEKIGVTTRDRVKISAEGGHVVTLVSITNSREVSGPGEIGVFADVLKRVSLEDGDEVDVTYVPPPPSVSLIKRKMAGGRLTSEEVEAIIRDAYEGFLSDVELTAFILALEYRGMDADEVESLTKAMASVGNRLDFGDSLVVDKHGIGGVPGTSKDSLIIVPIVASAGLLIPKTSSRAIMSPAGTADTMEVLAPVDLTAEEIVEITKRVGGVIAWTASANLSPVDSVFIERVEYPLSVDPESLIYASIMSKKYAAGIRRLLLDIPVGPEAKVESMRDARRIGRNMADLGERLGIHTEVAISYGGQPVGRCVGPALEAREALEILASGGKGSRSIVEKAVALAGILLEMGGVAPIGYGEKAARSILESRKAYQKMREIIEAQGGDPDVKPEDIPVGEYKETINAPTSGYVAAVSNKTIVRIARAAGAPRDKGAGVRIFAKRGDRVEAGQPLLEIYAESPAKLQNALEVARASPPIRIEGMVLEVIRERSLIRGF